jgi:hypothetical protein
MFRDAPVLIDAPSRPPLSPPSLSPRHRLSWASVFVARLARASSPIPICDATDDQTPRETCRLERIQEQPKLGGARSTPERAGDDLANDLSIRLSEG